MLKQAALALAVVCGPVLEASAQLVGVYADPLGTSCDLHMSYPGPTVDAYVVFTPGGGVDGIRAAGLRIDGLPSGWSASVIANPLGLSSGDVLGIGGWLSFQECTPGPVLLWRLTITPGGVAVDHELVVRYNLAQPADLSGGVVCPQFTPCDLNTYRGVLAEAHAIINGTTPCVARLGGRCPQAADVGGEPPVVDWGRVKHLYASLEAPNMALHPIVTGAGRR